jgi:glycosyltransferase involved in cell wall biosynthesis/SAM-dependent methyltransferase
MGSSRNVDQRRVALFTPLPPSRSGTADYAAALIAELAGLVNLQVFETVPRRFDPEAFDVVVYQIANNPYHAAIYELALQHPGVIVLHEANLHHLIQGMTLHKGDERAYLREVTYEIFGREAEEISLKDVPLEIPQPHLFTMLRRLLDRSSACIVHSSYCEREARLKGFRSPIARIPHGTAVHSLDARPYRDTLGIAPDAPVIGIFGYHRPDKKVWDCLRVFADLITLVPGTKLLIAGLPHPEVPLEESVKALGIQDHVHLLGFQTLADFDGYLAACDVVLNLRAPTFGETSGTMMRAFGLGKAVVVSAHGACHDVPDEICVKIPPDEHEQKVLLRCLQWLASDLRIAREIGSRARDWAARNCTWSQSAQLYKSFFDSILESPEKLDAASPPLPDPQSIRSFIERWVEPHSEAAAYVRHHSSRLVRTVELTPSGSAADRILEIGCYLQITPALTTLLGYGEARGCYMGETGQRDLRRIWSRDGQLFECVIDLFDAETDAFPYPDHHFQTVLCCEVLEHLQRDPMHMMTEIHRILQPGGTLVLTTPNNSSLRSVAAVLHRKNPNLYSGYQHPQSEHSRDPRHAREYTPDEILQLVADSGFTVSTIETGPYGDSNDAGLGWARTALTTLSLPTTLRGDCIYAVGRRQLESGTRFPAWLYSD